jgi:hypothetical protein
MTSRAWTTLAFSVLIVACGGTTTSLGSTGDGTSPQEQQDQDQTKGTGGSPDGSTGDPKDGGSADGADNSSNATCEANPILALAPCPPDEYCQSTAPGTCGSGKCKKRPPPPPPACPSLECACDGVIRCALHSPPVGFDIASPGSPSTPCAIACGPSTKCNGLTSYCEKSGGGPPPGVEFYECKPYPAACSTNHTCACVIANGAPNRVCTTEKDGKVSVFHPLP